MYFCINIGVLVVFRVFLGDVVGRDDVELGITIIASGWAFSGRSEQGFFLSIVE